MPPPLPPVILASALGALTGAQIQGAGAPPLARALGLGVGGALLLFAGVCVVEPGQAAVVVPPPAAAGDGSTVAPGTLQGALAEPAVAALVLGCLKAEGLEGEKIPPLAKAVGQSVVATLDVFVQKVKVAPGAAIAGFTTVAPGLLAPLGGPVNGWGLKELCAAKLRDNEVDGEGGRKLAGVLATVLGDACAGMIAGLTVAPGQGASLVATITPGKLI